LAITILPSPKPPFMRQIFAPVSPFTAQCIWLTTKLTCRGRPDELRTSSKALYQQSNHEPQSSYNTLSANELYNVSSPLWQMVSATLCDRVPPNGSVIHLYLAPSPFLESSI
jgi:hypothetical protein